MLYLFFLIHRVIGAVRSFFIEIHAEKMSEISWKTPGIDFFKFNGQPVAIRNWETHLYILERVNANNETSSCHSSPKTSTSHLMIWQYRIFFVKATISVYAISNNDSNCHPGRLLFFWFFCMGKISEFPNSNGTVFYKAFPCKWSAQ